MLDGADAIFRDRMAINVFLLYGYGNFATDFMSSLRAGPGLY